MDKFPEEDFKKALQSENLDKLIEILESTSRYGLVCSIAIELRKDGILFRLANRDDFPYELENARKTILRMCRPLFDAYAV